MKKPWHLRPLILVLIWVAAFRFWNTGASPPVLKISGSNPFHLSWPTNVPGFALQTKTNLSAAWQDWSVTPAIIGTNFVVTSAFDTSPGFFRLRNKHQLLCVNQLKQIGLGFRVWEFDFGGYPFQISTNQGGTREFRAIGPDGFDTNSFAHFQVLSNELNTPLLLVCPSDLSRIAATNFQDLGPENITYRLRTGDTVINDSGQIWALCPVDANALYYDGAVRTGTNY